MASPRDWSTWLLPTCIYERSHPTSGCEGSEPHGRASELQTPVARLWLVGLYEQNDKAQKLALAIASCHVSVSCTLRNRLYLIIIGTQTTNVRYQTRQHKLMNGWCMWLEVWLSGCAHQLSWVTTEIGRPNNHLRLYRLYWYLAIHLDQVSLHGCPSWVGTMSVGVDDGHYCVSYNGSVV